MGLGSGIRYPGSGKNLSRIWTKKAPNPGSEPSTMEKGVKKGRKVYYLGVEICLLLLCSEDGLDPARCCCQASIQP
jgi:hypothetical protein